jgi:ferredoxin
MRIVLDENKCSSLGMCEATAPDFFEVGDDGVLHLLDAAPADCHRALVEDAVEACPTGALSIED